MLQLRRLLALIILVPLMTVTARVGAGQEEAKPEGTKPQEAPARTIESIKKTAVERKTALAKLGYDIDLEKIKFSIKDKPSIIADIDRVQDVFFEASHWELWHFLVSGFGSHAPKSVEDFREETCRGMEPNIWAYYQVGAKEVVCREVPLISVLGGPETFNHILGHELIHAYQDAKFDLSKVLAKSRSTFEGVRIVSCIMEGEADWVAMASGLKPESLKTLTRDLVTSDLERKISGELILVYQAGRVFAFDRYREGGWDAVRGMISSLPTSTEQILHPKKLGQDQPRKVELPKVPLKLLHTDCAGELQTFFSLMNYCGVERKDAKLASIGWDGDRIGLYVAKNDEKVALWRTIWDREEDAKQFESAMKKQGVILRRGRLVDWHSACSPELAKIIAAAWAESKEAPPAIESDIASTTLVEKEWLAKQEKPGEVNGKLWQHEDKGISLPIPAGFETQKVRGFDLLMEMKDGLPSGGNINVISAPLVPQLSREEWMAENKKQMDQIDVLDLVSQKLGKVAETEVIFFEMMQQAGDLKLHFLSLVQIKDKKQNIVTCTAQEKDWERLFPVFKKALNGIVFSEK